VNYFPQSLFSRICLIMSRHHLFATVTNYAKRGPGIFLFTTASRMALGPTQPPVQWVPGALSLGVKRPGCEADNSPPSNAEVKEWVELYLHSANTPSWRGTWLKHRGNFTFTFTYYANVREHNMNSVASRCKEWLRGQVPYAKTTSNYGRGSLRLSYHNALFIWWKNG
jgi:hypothetical protein